MKKKHVASSFYEDRGLPVPEAEYVPENAVELQSLVTSDVGDRPRVVIGGGEHIRGMHAVDEGYDAIRTTDCDHILELDRVSKTVRVEAGITWGALRETLVEQDFSLQRYRLYPPKATVGGLLGRSYPTQKALFSGDIRDGCIARAAVSPRLGDYRYMVAPRKASGPDLRHLFMGGEGELGVILEATLEVWKPYPGRLLTWKASEIAEAVDLFREIEREGIRVSWCHWRRSTGDFVGALHAPTRLLDAIERRAHVVWGDGVSIEGEEKVETRRDYLETHLPDRRSAKQADKVVTATYSLRHLADAVESVGDVVSNVEVYDWNSHHATVFFTGVDPMESDTFPEATRQNALGMRSLVGADERIAPGWYDDMRDELVP